MKCSAILLTVLFVPFIYSQSLNLKDSTNQFDYVIITVPEFVNACQDFKLHKTKDMGLKTLVVDTSEILNQFQSENSEQENIRDFISYAGTFWKSPQPKYFLIAGDLSKIPNEIFVTLPNSPKTDTAMTDYFYSLNRYAVDTNSIAFYVGRIAARNVDELTNYFNKVINYENYASISEWNMRSLIIADDGITSTGNDGNIFEQFAIKLGSSFPQNFDLKYYFESDSSAYYGNKDSIFNFINNTGVSSVFLVGHGNSLKFTHQKLISAEDVSLLNNDNKYFIISSLFPNHFSDSNSTSITDQMLFKNDGALAGFSPVGVVYFSNDVSIFPNFTDHLYSYNHYSIGEAVKLAFASSNTTQNNIYNIFGDPSIKLKYDLLAGVAPSFKPSVFKLEQNYPNPFNPSTTIRFNLPKDDFIKLKIYDVLGNEISTLLSGNYTSGLHEVEFNGSNLSSGIYLYKLEGSSFSQIKKMVLLK